VIYLQQEGRGIGLANKVAAYALQASCGIDTVDANRALGLPDDVREYGAVRDILADLGVPAVRLLTNNPRKVSQLVALGVATTRQPLVVTAPSALAQAYVDTKVARMEHISRSSGT
jgi:GTP cyclohydrolase II